MARRIARLARAAVVALSFVGVVAGSGVAYACQGCPPSGGGRIDWLRYAEPPLAVSPQAPDTSDGLLVAGLGAIAGVVVFNMATGGTAALPFFAGAGAGAGAAAPLSASEGAVAVSRVYAVTSAVAGALAANWLFRPQEQRIRVVPSHVAARLSM